MAGLKVPTSQPDHEGKQRGRCYACAGRETRMMEVALDEDVAKPARITLSQHGNARQRASASVGRPMAMRRRPWRSGAGLARVDDGGGRRAKLTSYRKVQVAAEDVRRGCGVSRASTSRQGRGPAGLLTRS